MYICTVTSFIWHYSWGKEGGGGLQGICLISTHHTTLELYNKVRKTVYAYIRIELVDCVAVEK